MPTKHLLSLSGHLRREITATLLMGVGFGLFEVVCDFESSLIDMVSASQNPSTAC